MPARRAAGGGAAAGGEARGRGGQAREALGRRRRGVVEAEAPDERAVAAGGIPRREARRRSGEGERPEKPYQAGAEGRAVGGLGERRRRVVALDQEAVRACARDLLAACEQRRHDEEGKKP
jgi:hypothetical protein